MNIKEITKKDGSTVYRASVYLGVDVLTGKKVQTNVTAKTKKAIKTKAQQAITDFNLNGCTRLENTEYKTFNDLLTSWWDNHKLTVKKSTKSSYQNFIYNYIVPEIGSYKLEKISPRTIQNAVNKWAKNANKTHGHEDGATKSYPTIYRIIKSIFKYGVSVGAVSKNPASDVILPKIRKSENKKLKYLTNSDLKVWRNYLDGLAVTDKNIIDLTLYQFLLATGLRIGEALALNWSDIDLEKESVQVDKTLYLDSVQSTPKTSSSVRNVTFDKKTSLALRVYKQRQNLVFKSNGVKSDIVFTDSFGDRAKYSMLIYRLERDFLKAGLSPITFHGFRHTHASILLNAGVGYKEISNRLGHSQISMTIDIYSHLSKEKADEVAGVFEQAISNL
ncbi:tyrosine-type recombinase/integrase [Pseudolactococcus reticulitermitis]|uniref:Tyr recombinase domain-containing protein n=1 Tax=Pseudolactococcus reticulitermitis TaxID=2025039 RepID=A0A224XDX2_9LACT|nr:site-specific integrase [Lactococcus reticulitermitis]GAX48102.1 hypothetical protein RsY01_1716 [Lactococcus reticulitermitis]